MEKRNKIIKIRVTEEEHKQLLERSRSLHLAKWMREYCLDAKQKTVVKIPPVDPQLLRQISGISNNLNQIAKSLNVSIKSTQAIDKVVLNSRLVAIEREILELKARFSGDN